MAKVTQKLGRDLSLRQSFYNRINELLVVLLEVLPGAVACHADDQIALTEDTEGEEEVSWYGRRGKVRYVPLWKWLLEAN